MNNRKKQRKTERANETNK